VPDGVTQGIGVTVFDHFFTSPSNKLKDTSGTIENQELVVAAYQEQHDLWNNTVRNLEAKMASLNKQIQALKSSKDRWWERPLKLLKRKTGREVLIELLTAQLKSIDAQYAVVLNSMPNAEAYELAMLGGSIFRVK
jgi:chromosome segregation ATPase